MRSLVVGLVLAHQRNTSAHGAPKLFYQFAEPLVQALAGKAATSELAIEPCAGFFVHWRRPMRISARQGITVNSCDAMVCALPQPFD
ncbi:hypothetical protein ABIB66_008710 [Bradyrhizobium sp. F1.13.3]